MMIHPSSAGERPPLLVERGNFKMSPDWGLNTAYNIRLQKIVARWPIQILAMIVMQKILRHIFYSEWIRSEEEFERRRSFLSWSLLSPILYSSLPWSDTFV